MSFILSNSKPLYCYLCIQDIGFYYFVLSKEPICLSNPRSCHNPPQDPCTYNTVYCQISDTVCQTRVLAIINLKILCTQYTSCRRLCTSALTVAKIRSKVSVAWHSTKRQVLYVQAELVKNETKIRDILQLKKAYCTLECVNLSTTNAPTIQRNPVKLITISGLRKNRKIS